MNISRNKSHARRRDRWTPEPSRRRAGLHPAPPPVRALLGRAHLRVARLHDAGRRGGAGRCTPSPAARSTSVSSASCSSCRWRCSCWSRARSPTATTAGACCRSARSSKRWSRPRSRSPRSSAGSARNSSWRRSSSSASRAPSRRRPSRRCCRRSCRPRFSPAPLRRRPRRCRLATICGPALGGLLYTFGATVPYAVCFALLHRVGSAAGLPASRAADRQPDARQPRGIFRRHLLHPAEPDHPGRDLARHVRGAARRHHGVAADLRRRSVPHRPRGPRPSARGARHRRRRRFGDAGELAAHPAYRPDHVRVRRDVRASRPSCSRCRRRSCCRWRRWRCWALRTPSAS